MASHPLNSASAVIDALGGTTATSRIIGRKPAAVSNWRTKNKLPLKTFFRLNQELMRLGLQANHDLWGFDDEPEGRAA